MKILVVNAFEAGSHKANVINTVKIAEGFAKLGHDTHLLCFSPKSGALDTEELNHLYGLRRPITWHQVSGHFFGKKLSPHWPFLMVAFPKIMNIAPDLLYARNYIIPALASRFKLPTIGETHAWPDNQSGAFKTFLKSTAHPAFHRCVTISQHLATQYIQRGAVAEKMLVLPDAVDFDMFIPPENLSQTVSPYSQQEANNDKASIRGQAVNVVYAGHLYDYKGIPTILGAAALLPDIHFHLVGGLPKDIERQQGLINTQQLSNVTLHGLKPYCEVPPYLWHADILLLPPSANHPSAQWTSPVKLGEYLASGIPIIATQIPALSDCLSDMEVCFIPPDDAAAMATAIQRVLSNEILASQLQENASRKARQLTYENRVSTMLQGLVLKQ